MSEIIISAEHVSKKFYLSHEKRESYTALRDVISNKFKNLFKPDYANPDKDEFLALNDLNFDIQKGDRVGIIGRNGAGKSTLLKVLSRITEPTAGKIHIRGRVASLLEVGTGFHPELTGRENIFLNGAILGMSRNEIKSKFDEIVDFAEVERFLDTPVKRYSSGMYVRLAFAVAAHLEPEILIVDEVLAVGDAQFQKKCLGKMNDVSKKEGRTVLFVSHNLGAITSLCNKGIYLSNGQIAMQGEINSVIKSYMDAGTELQSEKIWDLESTPGNEFVKLLSVRTVNQFKQLTGDFKINEKVGLEMEYEVLQDGKIFWLGYNVFNAEGLNIFDTHSVNLESYSMPSAPGRYKAIAWIPENLLADGIHSVNCAIFNHNENIIHLHEKEVVNFNITDVFENNTARGESRGNFPGLVRPLLKWESNEIK